MATITPEEQEQERLQQAADDQLILDQQDAENIDVNQIENATPSDLKAMGIAKLPLLLLVIVFADLLKVVFIGDPEYWQAMKIVPVILLANFCFGIKLFFEFNKSNLLSKKFKLISIYPR